MINNGSPQKQTSIGYASSGFSLIELLIAMTLSVILLAGVITIYTNSRQTYNVQEGQSRLQENVRFAMDRLTKEISSAGYMGCLQSNAPVDPNDPVPELPIVNTLAMNANTTDFANPVFGTDNTGLNGSDTITLMRARGQTGIPVVAPMNDAQDNLTLNANHPDYGDLSRFDIVSISDCSKSVTFMISNTPTLAGIIEHRAGVQDPVSLQSNNMDSLEWTFGAERKSQATLLPVRGNTYSIRTSTQGTNAGGVCSPATPGFCALFENNDELVEGVQDLQILYGVDTSVPSNTAADVYSAANNPIDWNNVVSVRITLTVNEVERTQGSGNGITNGVPRTYTNTIQVRSRGV